MQVELDPLLKKTMTVCLWALSAPVGEGEHRVLAYWVSDYHMPHQPFIPLNMP